MLRKWWKIMKLNLAALQIHGHDPASSRCIPQPTSVRRTLLAAKGERQLSWTIGMTMNLLQQCLFLYRSRIAFTGVIKVGFTEMKPISFPRAASDSRNKSRIVVENKNTLARVVEFIHVIQVIETRQLTNYDTNDGRWWRSRCFIGACAVSGQTSSDRYYFLLQEVHLWRSTYATLPHM